MSKEVVIDRVAQALPAAGYFGAWMGGVTIQDAVAILTGIFVLMQIVKLGLEFRDRRAAKRKESVCPSAKD